MALGWKKGYIRYRSFFLDIYRVYKNRTDLKLFLEIILSLATISFFTYFALKPTAFTITELLKEIKAKEDVIARLDQKIKDLDTATGVYQSEPRLVLLDQALPNAPSPEDFARQIQGVAAQAGVTLNSLIIGKVTLVGKDEKTAVSIDQTALPEGSGEIDFGVNATGTYDNLSAFLTTLENMRRPIKIDNAIVNVAQLEGGDTISVTVSGRIPYLRN